MAEQRRREIGVRKVIGASVADIIAMLSTDIVKLVALSAVIAIPIAWLAMDQWLQKFAYRTSLQPPGGSHSPGFVNSSGIGAKFFH